MTGALVSYIGGTVFDGEALHADHVATFRDGVLLSLISLTRSTDAPGGEVIDLQGALLSPGFVDLQVNGGGGVLLNDDPSVETLERIASAHRSLGTLTLLPTLITDTPETTNAAIRATTDAIAEGVPGIAGLHLEGPHLSIARKGAHDGGLIRPIEQSDLDMLLAAARNLPLLKVTIAPESVTLAQVRALAEVGVLVSLGHTNATYETCLAYIEAGARVATHLFNAMSQLGSRAPGLVGAALSDGRVSCGLIADGIHVHPASIKAAWGAKTSPGNIFLVSDAMAIAGTELESFTLNGRRIFRQDQRLTLEDGTLAGADLDLATAVRVLHQQAGVPLDAALQAATQTPAKLIRRDARLIPGVTKLSDMIRIDPDLLRALPLTREDQSA